MLLSKAMLIASVLYPVTCDNPFHSPDGPTVVVIVHFLNCFNNFSRFRYSYMYIMLFITYICIFRDKLPSHIQTFGLLLILSRFIGLPRYPYQPLGRPLGPRSSPEFLGPPDSERTFNIVISSRRHRRWAKGAMDSTSVFFWPLLLPVTLWENKLG